MSLTDDDRMIAVGDPFPEIASVRAKAPFLVDVVWTSGLSEEIDLAPDIFTFRAYGPLRGNSELFQTVHIMTDGAAIAWGDDDVIDMPVSALERLASQAMTQDDLRHFMTA